VKVSSFFLSLFFTSLASGASFDARIVKLENKSQIYVPGEKKDSQLTHVKYMGNVYHVLPAERGMKLDSGYVVTTGPDSKLKVIYTNGDHFYVGPNSQYIIELQSKYEDKDKPASVLKVLRGAVRGLVIKDGPRSNMKIITKSSVMGIRGTDFEVRELGGGLSQISVMRGKVEILSSAATDKKTVVTTGQTFIQDGKQSSLKVLTKEDLTRMAAKADFKVEKEEKDNPENQVIKELENKATAAVINEIKEYQPDLYKQIEKTGKNMNSDQLAMKAAQILSQDAPSSEKKSNWDELNYKNDPYEKYKFESDK
jgi:hypothetical protein